MSAVAEVERQGTHKGCPYGDWGDAGWRNSFEWALVTNIDTRSARHVVGEGALRGRSPRTREGRIGPTAQLQQSVVSSQ